MPTYIVKVKRIYVKAQPPSFTKNGKPKLQPVTLRSMTLTDGVFQYSVCAKRKGYYVSRYTQHTPVAKGAATLFYGSTAAQTNSTIRKVRHMPLCGDQEFQEWLGKALGKRAAHNAMALLWAEPASTESTN